MKSSCESLPAGTPPRVVDELGRSFVAASSSRAFRKVLLGSGRKPRQLGPRNLADQVEKQSRSLSRAARRRRRASGSCSMDSAR
jgi:tripartite-type tricarboxylate transporter receptor subunit TctC